MKKVILYSTGCPRCNVLEKKLIQSGISFTVERDFDVEQFIEKGIATAPILEVDGDYKKFEDAVKWLREGK